MADDFGTTSGPDTQACALLIAGLRQFPIAIAVIGDAGRVQTVDGGLRHLIGDVAPSAHSGQSAEWAVHDEAGELLAPKDWPDARALRGEASVALAFADAGADDNQKNGRLALRFSAAPLEAGADGNAGARAVIILQDASSEHEAMERFGVGLRDMCVTAAADAIRRASVWPMPGAIQTPSYAHRVAARGAGPDGGLTPREAEVLRLIAWGHSHKDIGDQLGIAARTVEFHRSSAARKLDLRNRADIVRFALDRGWLQG